MKATVFVEKVGKKKFRATTSQPLSLETEGSSQDEALERLYELAKKRLASGQFFQMQLPDISATNPWQTFAGIWKDHPEFDAFLENIAEYRSSANRPNRSL
jgi:glutathione S-transferase